MRLIVIFVFLSALLLPSSSSGDGSPKQVIVHRARRGIRVVPALRGINKPPEWNPRVPSSPSRVTYSQTYVPPAQPVMINNPYVNQDLPVPEPRTPKNEFEIKAGDSLGIALHKMWYEEKQTVDTSIEAHVTREAVEQTIVDFLAVEDPEVQIIYGSTGEKWTIKYDGEEFAAGITTKQVVTVSYKTVDDWVCQRIRNHYKMKQQAAFVDHIRQGGEFTGCKVKIIGEIKREAGQAGG